MKFYKILDIPTIPNELLILDHEPTAVVPDIGYGLKHIKNGVRLYGARYSRNKLIYGPLINWLLENIKGISKQDISFGKTEHATGGYHIVHSDLNRSNTLNYYIDLGGDSVVTSWYQEKGKPLYRTKQEGGKQTDSGMVEYDNLDLLESVICERFKWYSFVNNVLHDAGPVIGCRSFISIKIR